MLTDVDLNDPVTLARQCNYVVEAALQILISYVP